MQMQMLQEEVIPPCPALDHSGETWAANHVFDRLVERLRAGVSVPMEQVTMLARFYMAHGVPGGWWDQVGAVLELLWEGVNDSAADTCPGCGESHEAGWLSRIV